ncbi:MAG: hypothetical protein FD145_1083 [Candidatus Saganbacteria bacterium]|uniref:GxxExxY protein n=1 Tax=Candidatus Saganbacteria bacterium TaxID=2575572 RepID=A0A833NWS2_UNCSA|nr:MAG: hypothetical protein FD145_1083 [Candidatus Saganbacteria bacterium]
MAAVFEVHNMLGPGFSENIYEKALIEEFKRQKIKFSNQHKLEVVFKGKIVGIHRLDFVIEDKIVLEIKAQADLLPIHMMQIKSYLKSGGYKLGLLTNFGKEKVEFKRILL